MSARAPTVLAVVTGSVLGAAAALVEPRPSTEAPVFTPAARLAAEPLRPMTAATAPRDVPPRAGPITTPRPVDAALAPLDAPPASGADQDPEEKIVACGRGDTPSCLEAADRLELRGETESALLHRRLAAQRLAERCFARRHDACALLAGLYERGQGVAKKPETAQALRERVLQLCKARPAAGCPQD